MEVPNEHKSNIPCLDLVTPHRELKDELMHVAGGAGHACFIGGLMVQSSKEELAAFCGTDRCVGGRKAVRIRFALMAAGIGAERGVLVVQVVENGQTFLGGTCEG